MRRAAARADQPVEAEDEFEREQREADRQRPQQPPFREHQVLDGDASPARRSRSSS